MPSYNKAGFAVEAARSVLEQDFEDWELWIMENSTDDKTRRLLNKFVPVDDPRILYREIDIDQKTRDCIWPAPWLLNQYYPQANGDIIMYISDDDLFMPEIFRHTVSYFDHFTDHDALYFHLVRTKAVGPGHGKNWDEQFASIAADNVRRKNDLDCQIDGGQIAYRKSVLDKIEQPWFLQDKVPDANHCDGIHMERLATEDVTFWPLPVPGVIHRHTLLSTWSN